MHVCWKKIIIITEDIRDLAIMIRSPTCMIKVGFGLTQAPRDAVWMESLEMVSLIRNKLEYFMDEPKCPKLSLLLVQDNPIRDISAYLFQQSTHVQSQSCQPIIY